jgi:hypothetical protein
MPAESGIYLRAKRSMMEKMCPTFDLLNELWGKTAETLLSQWGSRAAGSRWGLGSGLLGTREGEDW